MRIGVVPGASVAMAAGPAMPHAPGRSVAAPATQDPPLVVPGPELPGVPPNHPGLPAPAPSLTQLARLAETADPALRPPDGAHPSTLVNAHYANTRSQLAYALAGPYTCIEGDVRFRDGVPVMQHDNVSARDMTFEQWATLVHRAGRHMRIDVKDSEALGYVEATLCRLGVPDGMVTFNVGLGTPWFASNQSAETVIALRARHPRSWITINLPLPMGPVYEYAVRVARRIGPERLGTTILATNISEDSVRKLRTAFTFLNAWNVPNLRPIKDIPAETARLRAMGVNGMIDLRRPDDPLAADD